MSWISLAHTMACTPQATRLPADRAGARTRQLPAAPSTRVGGAVSGLGAARAGNTWRWAPSAGTPTADRDVHMLVRESTPVSIPVEVLREMRAAALASGCSESEVWAEAARVWLRQLRHDDGPLPPTPASAALAVPRRARSWSRIDAELADLRQPWRIAAPGEPAA